MLSHEINNPNNNPVITINIQLVPFGYRCVSALACKMANLRNFSLPFDWTNFLFPDKIQQVLENDFADFISNVDDGNFTNKYGIVLAHFNPDIECGKLEYERRIERFKQIMKNENDIKYFIYINENYPFNAEYRDELFLNKSFADMLMLEKFMKENYKIKFYIIYFDFKKHDIPLDSNIIQVLMKTDIIYERDETKIKFDMRKYYGKVLSEMFGTVLKIEKHDKSVFIG